jgi:hypothetical protein
MLPRVREIVMVASIDCPWAARRLRSAFCELIVFIHEFGNFGRPTHVVAAALSGNPTCSAYHTSTKHELLLLQGNYHFCTGETE